MTRRTAVSLFGFPSKNDNNFTNTMATTVSPSNSIDAMNDDSSWTSTSTPADVAKHLLDRFDGDKARTVEFWQACRRALEGDPTEAVVAQVDDEDDVLGESFLSEPPVLSFMSPRGKVLLEFYQGVVRAMDAKAPTVQAWRLKANQVAQVVLFPKPEDCKKDPAKKSTDICLLHLKEPLPVKNQKKPVTQVSFHLPAALPVWKTPPNVASEDSTVAWNQVLQQYLQNYSSAKTVRVHHPQATTPVAFKSYQQDGVSTTSGGMPFVNCYHGTKDGVLYPLMDGSLLFHKPPFLVPADSMEGITTGGRGGAGNSRYVDLVVQQVAGETLEFTNVNQEEVEGLQKFLALTQTVGGSPMQEDDDDDDEPEEQAGSRQRSKRKASADARRINKRIVVSVPVAEEDEDDEEEDIEYIAGTAVDEDDDSSSGSEQEDSGDEDGSFHRAEAHDDEETEEEETESEG